MDIHKGIWHFFLNAIVIQYSQGSISFGSSTISLLYANQESEQLSEQPTMLSADQLYQTNFSRLLGVTFSPPLIPGAPPDREYSQQTMEHDNVTN